MKAILQTILRAAPGVGVALVSACVGPMPAPAPAPAPPLTQSLPPRPAQAPAAWHDLPATAGIWQWHREGALSVARFGPSPALFSLTCDPAAGMIAVYRSASGSATTITILTSSLAEKLSIVPGTAGARLPARDPLLDAMAFSRGRFAVEVPGTPDLYLPSWPEVSRVIEDCRQPLGRLP